MIFDTNVHLTVSNTYLHKKNLYLNIQKKFETLFALHKLKGFACVGLANKGSYEHNKFYKKFNKKKIIPVAAFNLKKNFQSEIRKIKKLGFNTIKIHPRSYNLTLEKINLDKIFYYSNKYQIKIQICTYFNNIPKYFYSSDPKYIFSKNYKKYPDLKIMLMHAGCERILEFAELCRFSKNLFLDLSMTINKYETSSLDQDIQFLFNSFDTKILLGSDYPEVDYSLFIKRIKIFSKKINAEKKKNIFFKNAYTFFS